MLNGRNVKMQEGGAKVEQKGGKDFIPLCQANSLLRVDEDGPRLQGKYYNSSRWVASLMALSR